MKCIELSISDERFLKSTILLKVRAALTATFDNHLLFMNLSQSNLVKTLGIFILLSCLTQLSDSAIIIPN